MLIPRRSNSSIAAAFAVVAAVIGLIDGLFGRIGWFRPRPNRSAAELVVGAVFALVVVGAMAYYAYSRFYAASLRADPVDQWQARPRLRDPGVARGCIFRHCCGGRLPGPPLPAEGPDRRLRRRWLGVTTGSTAALISAPIAANVFGGVTGSGTDFLVAAFRQGGSDIAGRDAAARAAGRSGRQVADRPRGLPGAQRHGTPHQGALPAGRAPDRRWRGLRLMRRTCRPPAPDREGAPA